MDTKQSFEAEGAFRHAVEVGAKGHFTIFGKVTPVWP
jgi:hypothetical protein